MEMYTFPRLEIQKCIYPTTTKMRKVACYSNRFSYAFRQARAIWNMDLATRFQFCLYGINKTNAALTPCLHNFDRN